MYIPIVILCIALFHCIFRGEGSVWAVLDLEDGRGLDHLHRVPLILRDMYPIIACGGIDQMAFRLGPGFIVEHHAQFAAQQYVGLSRMAVPVYGQHGARQQHVDESLRLCVQTLVQVIIHAKPRRLFGFSCNSVEKFVIYYHDTLMISNAYSSAGCPQPRIKHGPKSL